MTEEDEKQETASVTTGQTFTETYPIAEDVKTKPSLHISQEVFPLCEADFLRLKHSASKATGWGVAVSMTGFVMLLVPIAKFMQAKFAQTQPAIEPWEWIVPFVAFLIASILFLAAKFLPDEGKRVMKDIESHFSGAPRTRHLGGRNQ